MPKLLPQVRERLVQAARDALARGGYGGLSVRELAGSCQIAVGTFYHYFPTKNDLVAAVMLEDWVRMLAAMDGVLARAGSFAEGMGGFYDALACFVAQYSPSWTQFSQKGDAIGVIQTHHRQLRGQLAQRVGALAQASGAQALAPLIDLLAETLLTSVIQPDIDKDQFLSLLRALQK